MGVRTEAPIIIIGNGGSGSTVLDRMLGAHPELLMTGELRFLVPKLWYSLDTVTEQVLNCLIDLPGTRARFPAQRLYARIDADPAFRTSIGHASGEDLAAFVRPLEAEEQLRVGTVVRHTMEEWLCLREATARYWGFKEIWNGSNADRHDWSIYDNIFPEAHWLHIIRHPAYQVRSAARLSGLPLTPPNVRKLLEQWLDVVNKSRERANVGVGRYCEVRYEDLLADPERALGPLFAQLGISWRAECRSPLDFQWGPGSKMDTLPASTPRIVSATAGLMAVMDELGYRLEDAEPSVAVDARARRPPLTPAGEGRWLISGEVIREVGRCWQLNLGQTELAEQLAAVTDDVGAATRSPLRLFEDEQMLEPAHSLHLNIRLAGGGGYSHWQNFLMFSTSDNSNPNTNGRKYTFRL